MDVKIDQDLAMDILRRWTRRVFLLSLLAGFSAGSIVGFVMWLAIQLFHP